MAVHVELTDGHGTIPIKLRLVDVDDEEDPVFEVENEIDFADPRAIVSMSVYMQGLAFPKAGEYRLQLFAGSTFLIERRLLLRQVNP